MRKPLSREGAKPEATIKEFEINRTLLDFQRIIGEGNFAKVYLAKFKQIKPVAVKQLKAESEDNNSTPIQIQQSRSNFVQGAGGFCGKPNRTQKEKFVLEARNLAKLQHPKIVQLLGICVEKEPFFIITEYMPKGNLRKYLISNGPTRIPLKVLLDMLAQVFI